MKLTIIGILAFAVVSGSCKPQSDEIELSLAEVGDKTDLYTVVAANRLELAPGVTMQPTDGPCGAGSGMLLMRQGEIGGYVTCGCVGATTSTCRTSNDNPNHPECTGGCTDSEGKGHACGVSDPLPGPPKNPLLIKFRAD